MAQEDVQNILQAMIANAQSAQGARNAQQQKVRDQEEIRAHQAEEKYRGDTLQHAIDTVTQQHELEKERIDLDSQRQQNELSQKHLENVREMRRDISTGVQPIVNNPAGPTENGAGDTYGVQQPANSTQVGNSSDFLDNATLQKPQDRIAQIEAEAKAKASGEYEGNKKLYADQLAQQKSALDAQKAKENQTRQDSINQSRQLIEAIAANKHGVTHGVDPDLVQSLGENAATGQADLKGTTPATLAAGKYLQDTGQKPFGTKQSNSLKSAAAINSFFDDVRSFANELPESKTGAMVNGILQKATPFPTDLKNHLDILKQNAVNVGKNIEGVTGGKITNRQLDLMINGMASVGKTKQQVIDDANALQNKFKTSVNSTILGGYSAAQRAKILDAHGMSEADVSGSPTQSNGKQIDQATASKFLVQAGGDKDKAREAAKAAGYTF